jgi:hypothetical protein
MQHRLRLSTLSLVILASTACGGSHEPNVHPTPSDTVTCGSSTADAPNAGLSRQGALGRYTFELAAFDPAPPVVGTNTWTVRVLDANEAPVTGAQLAIKAFMPLHGHGSSAVPQITPQGDSYSIAGVYLFMPGLWQITLTATTADGTDSAVFNFCIDG